MSTEVQKEETEDLDVFFDANDFFDENVDQNHKKKASNKNEKKNWLGIDWSDQKIEEPNRELSEETVILIKDKLRNTENSEQTSDELNAELTQKEQSLTDTDHNSVTHNNKVTKIDIISDNDESDETESRGMEVTVINEDNIRINTDDIEMSSYESVKFLINIIAVLVLSLFIISGTSHWIYNYLNGLDWYLSDKTHYNFHIFFMCLGICSFSIGLLSHRIFRGLSSGALNCMHTVLTLITLTFFVIGYYAVFISLEDKKSLHFYSVHSWLGLISIASFTLQWLSGLVIFVFPKFVYDIQVLLIPIHSFSGRIIFSLFCGTTITGFSDKLKITDSSISLGPIEESNGMTNDERELHPYWEIPDEAFICNLISLVILLYILSVNYLISNDNFRRRLLPEEQGIEIKTRFK